MRIFYTERAFEDIERIEPWIGEESPRSAKRVVAEIIAATDLLADFLLLGHEGDVAGTRELIVSRLPFIVIYRVDPARDEVVVLAVFHAAQNRSDWLG